MWLAFSSFYWCVSGFFANPDLYKVGQHFSKTGENKFIIILIDCLFLHFVDGSPDCYVVTHDLLSVMLSTNLVNVMDLLLLFIIFFVFF